MLNLNNINWEQYKIKDIFDIENCRCSNVTKLSEGNIPYIGATNRNNGVLKFVKDDSLFTKGNCIVFICDGEGSIGYSIYKKEDFIGSTTLKVGRNRKLNKYNALFITTIADTIRGKYNFGFKRNEKHLKNEILLLPADENNDPDWDFMESYMEAKENFLLMRYRSYLNDKVLKIQESNYLFLEGNFKNIKWREFLIEDLFQVQRGKRLTKKDRRYGKIPFYSAAEYNNGVTDFISNPLFVEKNKILVTIFGDAFFAEGEFTASDDVTILNNAELNKYNSLFVCEMIQNNKEKFKFGYKCFSSRIKRQTILLPLDENNDPDWDFMESYIKQLEYKKITKYLDYIEDRIN